MPVLAAMANGKTPKRTPASHGIKRSIGDLQDGNPVQRPTPAELKSKVKPFSPAEFKKSALGLAAGGAATNGRTANGIKNVKQSHFDQSRAVVITGQDPVDASMSEAESSADESEAGESSDDEVMDEAEDTTSKELTLARRDEPVDVDSAFATTSAALVPSAASGLPAASSLSTVLSQALRTSDSVLLDSCLGTADETTITATVQRLDSSLAASLLQKLAEKLHRRPKHAGAMMKWVQWTLVAHGGYLASREDIVKDLSALYRVITERTNTLKPLLALKGRLDMLDAQMRLREQQQIRSLAIEGGDGSAMVYVEDEEEEAEVSDSDEEADLDLTEGISLAKDRSIQRGDEMDSSDGALIDDEASETSNDSGDDNDSSDESGSESDIDGEDSDDPGSLADFVATESEEEEEQPKPKKRRQ